MLGHATTRSRTRPPGSRPNSNCASGSRPSGHRSRSP